MACSWSPPSGLPSLAALCLVGLALVGLLGLLLLPRGERLKLLLPLLLLLKLLLLLLLRDIDRDREWLLLRLLLRLPLKLRLRLRLRLRLGLRLSKLVPQCLVVERPRFGGTPTSPCGLLELSILRPGRFPPSLWRVSAALFSNVLSKVFSRLLFTVVSNV